MSEFSYDKVYETTLGIKIIVKDTQTGKSIGRILVSRFGTTAHIDDIRVIPTYTRMGIGNTLLQKGDEWAQQNNCRRAVRIGFLCELDSHTDWGKSERLFRRNGYKRLGPVVIKKY